MTTINDVLQMSEPELSRRGSVSKQMLIQALMEAKKQNSKQKPVEQPQDIVSALEDMLTKRLDPIISKFSSLVQKVSDLADHVNELQRKCELLSETRQEISEDFIWEAEQRYKKRKFVIVSGLSEQRTGSVEERKAFDLQAINTLTSAIGLESFNPRYLSRLGRIDPTKPRLLRFKCNSAEERATLLRKSRELRDYDSYKHVYLNPDQTKSQREKSRLLRLELKKRREDGESVMIRHGKIVSKQMSQNFQ